MKRIFSRGIVLFLAVLCAAGANAALSKPEEMYLRLDGIEGEAKDAAHSEWIEVLECDLGHSHGTLQSIQTGSPDAVGRGLYAPFTFKHPVDKATPKLQEACMKGSIFANGELHVCQASNGVNIVAYTVKIDRIKVVKAQVGIRDLPKNAFQLVEEVHLLCSNITEEVWHPEIPVTVRLPALPAHLSASWTVDGQAVPQSITGSTFTTPSGSKNVTIHFAADAGYMLIGAAELNLGAPAADVSVSPDDIPDVAVEAKDVAYRMWTGSGFVEGTTNAAVVSAETTRLVDGYWYVAQDAVANTNRLTVSGSAHLILADGATLSTKGVLVREGRALSIYGQASGTGTLVADASADDSLAGIGGDGDFAAGAVSIHGGIVRATGGADAAGIGGGREHAGGEIAIYGGRVEAAGGALAPGIGGGRDQLSGVGVFRLVGGTVRAAKGENTTVAVGHAGDGSGVCSNIVCGGSLEVDGAIVSAPVDAAGRGLFEMKVRMPAGTDENAPVALAGLAGYGGESIYPIDGAFHLWLPRGNYDFTANGLDCTVRVFDRAVTIVAGATGLRVNGEEIAIGAGEGWTFGDGVLTLGVQDGLTYVVDGVLTGACVRVGGTGSTVVLSNAMITVTNAPALSIDDGCDVRIVMAGETSQLESDNGFAAIRVPVDAGVTFDTLRREAILYCFTTNGAAAVGGNVRELYGNITIADGIIDAWSGDAGGRGAAIGSGALPDGAQAPTDEPGDITISGGFLYAEAAEGSPALGAGAGNRGGRVVVTGGTVQLKRAEGVAEGASISASEVKITGGSVVDTAGLMMPAPSNGTARVWRVDLPAELLTRASQTNSLELSGLDGYGLDGIVPFEGLASVWLPNGVHRLDVRLNGSLIKLSATVADANTVFAIDDFEGKRGVAINGVDVGWGAGPGWQLCDDNYVQLDGTVDNPVISGTNTRGTVMIEIDANMKLTLSNLSLRCATYDECCLWATNDVTARILLIGENELYGTYDGEGICLENGCDLTIAAAPGLTDGEAVLKVKGSSSCPGIGIARHGTNGERPRLTIESGTIRAWGGSFSPAIGGNRRTLVKEGDSCDSEIRILGGRVFAEGGLGAAGIGLPAQFEKGGTMDITISGGVVEARGAEGAAGIGGGYETPWVNGRIEITGGTVAASHGDRGKAAYDPAADVGFGEGLNNSGRFVISGGSVVLDHIAAEAPRPAPTNAADAAVWCVTFEDVQPVVETTTEVTEVPDGGFYTNVSEVIETTVTISTNEFGVVSTNIDEQVTVSTNLVPTFVTVTNVTVTRTYPVTGAPAGYDVRGIEPVGGKVMLWLPNGDYAIGIGAGDYVVRVTNGNVTATKLEDVVLVPSGGLSQGYASKELAEYMMSRARVQPPPEAEKALTTQQAWDNYQSYFSFRLVQDGNLWKFEPYMPPVSTNLLQQSVDNAMSEFDIRGVSELEMGEQAEMDFGWCVPGFFYTLQSGATLKGIRPAEGATKPSTSDSHVVLPITKPDESAGFFRLSVSETIPD